MSTEPTQSLSRRDEFARAAMQGLLSNLEGIRREGFKDIDVSIYARMQADWLIAELDGEAFPESKPPECTEYGLKEDQHYLMEHEFTTESFQLADLL